METRGPKSNSPSFYACPGYQQLWWLFEQKWMSWHGDTYFPIISLWEICLTPRAANSVVSGSIWPKFEVFREFMHALVICKYKKDRIKNNREKVETSFHLRGNNILTPLQSRFIPGNSTVSQLTFLYNTFCHALDEGKEIRVVFCDTKKAFGRVWHAGLLHRLRACGVSGSLLDWFKDYLSNRRQRVVLPGANSGWTFIRAEVPQGSV